MKRIVILCAVAAVAVVAAFTVVGSGSSNERTLTGYFADSSPLEVGNEVRIDGVKVGSVKSISLENKVAKVTFSVERDVLPLHDGARLQIKPINLLGENYVSIADGKTSAPYSQDTTIPLARTSSSVNLQDVLDTFADPTSTALAAMVATLGDGLNGNGQKAADAIRALAPTMDRLTQLGDIIKQQNSVLDDLVDKADPVAASVAADNGRGLDRLIENARTTLAALGDNQAAIEETVAQLPTTLRVAQTTMDNLGAVARTVRPTLRKARPVTRNLSTISDEIVNFAKYATPAFNNFGPLFARADELLKAAAPVAKVLRQHGGNLKRTATLTKPVGDQLLHQHLGDLMAFVTKWALSTNARDGASHYFRGLVYLSPKALTSLVGINTGAGTPSTAKGGGKGTSSLGGAVGGLVNGTLGSVQSGLGGLLGGLLGSSNQHKSSGGKTSGGGLLGSLLGGRPSQRTSATGLTKTQENALLTQLIGS